MQTTDWDVPLLLQQICDLLTCLGIALPVHRTNSFKWLPNHWEPYAYFILQSCTVWRRHGGEIWGKSKIFMNQFAQQVQIYRVFVGRSRSSCIKIVFTADSNPRIQVWNYLRPRLDVLQPVRPLRHHLKLLQVDYKRIKYMHHSLLDGA